MITQYFNGEIVRHPDMKAIRVRTIQNRETNKICCFGIPELYCKTFQKWRNDPANVRFNGRCLLCNKYRTETDESGFDWKIYYCPRAQSRYVNQIKTKHFSIDYKVYRKLSSAAHYIIKESVNKTLFITLTFGKFKKDEITEREANKCFSKFVENLRENYGIEHYLGVRERGKNNGRLHFHLVVSMPFVSFVDINRAWCHATSEYSEFSKNAVQTDGTNKIIKSPARAIRYVCKYISKNIQNKLTPVEDLSTSRIYFISNSALSSLYINECTGEIKKLSNIKRTISNRKLNINELLKDYKGIYIQSYDYVTVFKITDLKEFQRFSYNIIYPLFDCENKSNGLRHNPDKSK